MRRALLALLSLLLTAALAADAGTIYVDSNATGGADDGTSWTDAFLSIDSADDAAWIDGDEIWVADDHAETHSGSRWDFLNGIAGSETGVQVVVRSVDKTDDSYSIASAAQFEVTDIQSIRIYPRGALYQGIYFKTNGGLPDPYGAFMRFEDVTFENNSSSSNEQLLGSQGWANGATLVNCTLLGSSTMTLRNQNLPWRMYGGSISAPDYSTVNSFSGSATGSRWILGVDLASDMAANDVFLDDGSNQHSSTTGAWYIIGSKVSGSMDWWRYGTGISAWSRIINRPDYDDVDDQMGHGSGVSVSYDQATYRDDGFAMYSGSANEVPGSLKITLNADAAAYPQELPPIYGWAEAGSQTIKLHLVHDLSASLQDDEIGLEIFYPKNAAAPKLGYENTRTAPQGTPANHATSSETWTGASGKTKQEISITVTFNEIGWYKIIPWVRVYEAGKFIHLDILPEVS